MKKCFALLLLLSLLLTNYAFANYVENEEVEIVQLDGEKYTCYVTGDEYFHRIHDKDGYVICLEQDGYYYYASGFSGENWIASPYKVGEIDPKTTLLKPWISPPDSYFTQKIIPLKSASTVTSQGMTNGSSTAIMILVRFSDQTDFTESYLSDLDSTLSAKTEPSVYTYYQEVSYGKLFLNGYIIRNTYTDSHPRAYYLPYNATTNPIGYNDNEKQSRRNALLNAAIRYVADKLPTGMSHDMNRDGKFDFVSFVIKGNSGAWGDLLWPHATSDSFSGFTINGLKFGPHIFMTENKTNKTTFTHEFFHNMGAPDVYRYTNTDISPAPYMFADNNHPCSFYKWEHSQGTWVKEIPEITQSGEYTLYPLASTDNFGSKKCAYKIASPYNPTEFFIVEYRQKIATTQDNVSKSGMLVYRVNPTKNGNGGGPPDELYVYRPTGTFLHNGTPSDVMFGENYTLTHITDNSYPSCYLSNGFQGGLDIEDVGVPGDSIVFKVNLHPQTTVLSGGNYALSNVLVNKLLGIGDSTLSCTSTESTDQNLWTLDYVDNSLWKIINRATGKVLTIPGNTTTPGTRLSVDNYSGAVGQKWYIFGAGENKFRIVSLLDKNLCITLSSGAIATATFNASNTASQWQFERKSNYIEEAVQYSFLSNQSGKAVESNSTTKLVQNTLDVRKATQQWLFEKTGDSVSEFRIKSKSLGTYLSTNGTTIEMKLQADASVWKLLPSTEGTVKISDMLSGKVLATGSGIYSNLSEITLESAADEAIQQQFKLVNITNFKSNYVEPEYPEVTLEDLKRDLYIYLPFENEMINKVENAEIELNITATGNPNYAAGKVGQCLSFNGSTDYITIQSQATFNPAAEDFTISVWAYNEADGTDTGDRVILQQANGDDGSVGRTIMHYAPKTDCFASYLGNMVSAGLAGSYQNSIRKWTHISFVCNVTDKTMTIVNNGVVETKTTLTSGIEWCNGNLLLGAQKAFSASRMFKGKLDEFAIYKRALNPAEIRALMADGLHKIPSGNVEIGKSEKVIAYPNPASSKIYIEGLSNSNASIQVMNLNGATVLTGQYSKSGFDVSTLNNGIYFVRVKSKNVDSIQKISINR